VGLAVKLAQLSIQLPANNKYLFASFLLLDGYVSQILYQTVKKIAFSFLLKATVGLDVNRIGFEPMACCLEIFRHIFAIPETQASSGFNKSKIPKIRFKIQFCGQILWPNKTL